MAKLDITIGDAKPPNLNPLVGLAMGAVVGLIIGSLTNEGTPGVIIANMIFWGMLGMSKPLIDIWFESQGK